MEANTVVLTLRDYQELKDFRDSIEKDGMVISSYRWGGEQTYFYTKEESSKELLLHIRLLEEKVKDLQNPPKKEITLGDIKKMSVRDFKRWRKQ